MTRYFLSSILSSVLLPGAVLAGSDDSMMLPTVAPEAVAAANCGSTIDKQVPYLEALRIAIERCLIYPPYIQDGAKCRLRVVQSAQGKVTGVSVMECSGHPKFGEFAERAVLKASPLPLPVKGSSFLPEFGIIFSPDVQRIRQSLLANPAPVQEIHMDSPPPRPFSFSEPELKYRATLVGTIRQNLRNSSTIAEQICSATITQNRLGEVQRVEIRQCDSKEMASAVEAAVYKSSPLPLPADIALFKPRVEIAIATPPQRIAQVARPISEPSKPYYPESARKQNQEGTATVKLLVLRDGTVKSVSIERSSGFSALDDQAMKIIQEAKWAPAIATTGEPMDSTLVLPIVFRLKD